MRVGNDRRRGHGNPIDLDYRVIPLYRTCMHREQVLPRHDHPDTDVVGV